MYPEKEAQILQKSFNCKSCAAVLNYAPGTQVLKCQYCGCEDNIIPAEDEEEILVYDYHEFVVQTQQISDENTRKLEVISCGNCGSSTTFDANVTATQCPFCTTPLIIELKNSKKYIEPHYMLPFLFDKNTAVESFHKWLRGLWFAPNELKKMVGTNALSPLKGIYLPHWLYDADTTTEYSGERGEYYYETETYSVRENGRDVQKTRQVRRTRWYGVSGSVDNSFENITVTASQSLPKDLVDDLTPWPFEKLKGFDERYLSGFNAETYKVKPDEGFSEAQEIMASEIEDTIRSDIGGDEQRISHTDVEYFNVGIKYVLLPVWVSSFRYNNKVYQFIVNATTGEVKGKRPYSVVKIVLLVVAVIVAVLFIVAMVNRR